MTAMPRPSQFQTVARRDEHLLPPNATPLERALSASDQRLFRVPVWVIRAFWNVDRCPAHLLPYLAASWSVDEWDPARSEAEKRDAIRESVWLHQHKGTVGALKRALARLRLGVTVSEWFEHAGAPYTFRLRVALARGATWTADQAAQLLRVAVAAKNVRSYLDRVTIAPPPEEIVLRPGIAVHVRVRTRPVMTPITAIAAPRDYVRVGVIVQTRIRVRCAALGA